MAKGRRGGFPGMGGGMGGGMNMNQLMQQAQKMQREMEKAQEELAELIVETSSGGGMVNVKINGKKEIQEILIDPSVIDADDVEMLQDLIVAAINEAIRTLEEKTEARMGKISGGSGFPGL